jgi:hypothetical protein
VTLGSPVVNAFDLAVLATKCFARVSRLVKPYIYDLDFRRTPSLLLLALNLGPINSAWSLPPQPQRENTSIGENQREAKKAAKQQQKLNKKAAKKDLKARKKYLKAQKKAAKQQPRRTKPH